jgi:hypothetical protein
MLLSVGAKVLGNDHLRRSGRLDGHVLIFSCAKSKD